MTKLTYKPDQFQGACTELPMSLSADEWQDYFYAHKSDILRLIDENRRLVTELDSMVFDLYGLTEEQRNIIVRSLESE